MVQLSAYSRPPKLKEADFTGVALCAQRFRSYDAEISRLTNRGRAKSAGIFRATRHSVAGARSPR
jgi:hypothetical protein